MTLKRSVGYNYNTEYIRYIVNHQRRVFWHTSLPRIKLTDICWNGSGLVNLQVGPAPMDKTCVGVATSQTQCVGCAAARWADDLKKLGYKCRRHKIERNGCSRGDLCSAVLMFRNFMNTIRDAGFNTYFHRYIKWRLLAKPLGSIPHTLGLADVLLLDAITRGCIVFYDIKWRDGQFVLPFRTLTFEKHCHCAL